MSRNWLNGCSGNTIAGTEQETSATNPTRLGRYGVLLPVLIGSYLLSSFATGSQVTAVQVALFGIAAVLALRGSQVPRRIGWLVFLIVVVGSAITVGLARGPGINVGVSYLWAALVLLGAIVMIVHRDPPVSHLRILCLPAELLYRFSIGGTVLIPAGSISQVWILVAIGASLLLWFFLHIRSAERRGRDVLLRSGRGRVQGHQGRADQHQPVRRAVEQAARRLRP